MKNINGLNNSIETDKLSFRRQFIFQDKKISGFESWKSDIFLFEDKTWYLCYHPDLNYLRARNQCHEIVLLGYILDPENPPYDNQTILNDIIQNTTVEVMLKKLEKYNGRFVLIILSSKELIVVNDAVGFRELYYTFTNNGFACGSTPNLIAEVLNIPKTKDFDIIAFHQSEEFVKADSMWIGNDTLYEDVFQLLPNNYLDVFRRKVIRFWPKEPINKININDCAKECAEILKGTITSAINRYELHMGITAGWDTRLLLSASRDFKDEIFYYINKPKSLDDKSGDLRIAKKLSEILDFKLNIIQSSNNVSKEFRSLFLKNNILARELLLPVFYEVYKRNWDKTYTVSGTMANGLARIYMRIPKGIEINGKSIAIFSGYSKLTYAVKSFDKWVNEVKLICDECNINIMDLYQMEQDNSHWGALTSSEQDIVREEIRPFNNRQLIKLFWSLEPKYRYQYYPIIYKKIMRILWQEVLKQPFNPSLRSNLYGIFRFFGIERAIYSYYKKKKYFKLKRNG